MIDQFLNCPIYIIEAEGLDVVKIGYSANPLMRFRSLAIASPAPLILRALLPGDRQTEKDYHREFRDFWSHGEWFHIAPPISSLMEIHAVPVQNYLNLGRRPSPYVAYQPLLVQP